ncbi:MAG TPA: hypothetical protein VHZ31_04825 [Solirubrobacteraceae bacterium]|jgi:hypothetical protein|nr:hypothetical protein [Solirubrobacteraceae bacterium]
MTDVLDRFDSQLIEAGERLSAAAPRHRKRRRIRQGAIAIIAVGLTGGVAAAATTLNEPGPSVSAAPSQPIHAGLSALSSAPLASPADTAAIQRNLDNRPGESATGAQLLPFAAEVADTPDHRTIVAVGPKYVCMQTSASKYSSSTCSTHAVATNPKTPMVDVTIVDNGYLVSALLPDGVSEAILKTRNGDRTTLTPKQNFASAVVADPPDDMSLSTADGPVTVSLSAVAAPPTHK